MPTPSAPENPPPTDPPRPYVPSATDALVKMAEGAVERPDHSSDWLPPDRSPHRRRKVRGPLLLFVATCLSTFWAAATDWQPLYYLGDAGQAWAQIARNWQQGLTYMGAVLAILLTHEMGHFLTTLRYRIPASYPIFIPVPFNAIGTMGAVIGMDGLRANRRQMFDLGLSGPLAGLVVAIPVMWLGIMNLNLSGAPAGIAYHNPLLMQLMIHYLRPDLKDVALVGTNQLNAFFMAGWVGLLVTGLNMLPVSQLDGGHVLYALFGKRAHVVARTFVISAIIFIIIWEVYLWTLMLVLVILIGTDHPPTSDDRARLGPLRVAVGVASLAIPVLCFSPWGVSIP